MNKKKIFVTIACSFAIAIFVLLLVSNCLIVYRSLHQLANLEKLGYHEDIIYIQQICYIVKYFMSVFCDAICLAGLVLCLVNCFKPVRPKAKALTAYSSLLICISVLLLVAECSLIALYFKYQENPVVNYSVYIVNEFAKVFFLVLMIVLAAFSIKYFNSANFGKTNEEQLNEIKEEQEALRLKQIEKKQKRIAKLQAQLEELNNPNDNLNEPDGNE